MFPSVHSLQEGFSQTSLADAKISAAPETGTRCLHGEIVAWPRLLALLIMQQLIYI